MLWRVPPAETHVESTHKRDGLVDNAQFLMLAGGRLSYAGDGSKGVSYVSPIQRPGLEVAGGMLNHDILSM